jgi:hypothetical protein
MQYFRFWISGEIQGDVPDFAFINARKTIESVLNKCAEEKNYGEGLKEWAFIAIILKSGFDEYYPEIKKYRPKKKEVEFRLKISFEEFLKGDSKIQLKLFAESVLRSLDLMREMKIKDFDLEKFTKDVTQCLSQFL